MQAIGYGKFLDAYDALAPGERDPDWQRAAVLVIGGDVEAGNRWTPAGLIVQVDEAARIWSTFHDGEFSQARLIRDLNDPPSASSIHASLTGSVVHVIDWELWAGFLHRHLCARIAYLAKHYYSAQGLPEEAENFINAADQRFGGLTLYPIAARMMAQSETDYRRAMVGARELVRQHPERVTAQAWRVLRTKPDFARQSEPFASDDAWMRPYVPTGTALELGWRSLAPRSTRPVDIQQRRRWADAAPYDPWVVWLTAWDVPHGGDGPTMEVARNTMALLLLYDRKAVSLVYEYIKGTSAERLELARTWCTLDENDCDHVASQLLHDGRDAEAADAYQYWIDHARNTVATSQQVDWLVWYYEDHGRRDRAMQIATDAASVNSGGGLATLGRLLDRRGRYDEAEKLFRTIDERYANKNYLAAHFLRVARRTHDKALEARAAALLTAYSPQGFEPANVSRFSAPPQDGMVFKTYGGRAARTGLLRDDVIVGAEGIRIHSYWQYWFVAQSGDDPHMRFIVWRNGRYQEVQALVPQRWFAVGFDDYSVSRK